MIKPEVVKDEGMIPLAREICKKIESDLEYPGQIKVNIIRESRAIDYAKQSCSKNTFSTEKIQS